MAIKQKKKGFIIVRTRRPILNWITQPANLYDGIKFLSTLCIILKFAALPPPRFLSREPPTHTSPVIKLPFNPKSIVPADWEDRARPVQDFIFIAIVSWCVCICHTRVHPNGSMNLGHIFLISTSTHSLKGIDLNTDIHDERDFED